MNARTYIRRGHSHHTTSDRIFSIDFVDFYFRRFSVNPHYRVTVWEHGNEYRSKSLALSFSYITKQLHYYIAVAFDILLQLLHLSTKQKRNRFLLHSFDRLEVWNERSLAKLGKNIKKNNDSEIFEKQIFHSRTCFERNQLFTKSK